MSTADIYDNNVRSDLFDILVGNAIIRFCLQQITEFIIPRYHDTAYPAAALLKLKIPDPAKLPAVS